jgi:hypothetical protein
MSPQSPQHYSANSSFQPRRMPADLLPLVLIVSLTIDARITSSQGLGRTRIQNQYVFDLTQVVNI